MFDPEHEHQVGGCADGSVICHISELVQLEAHRNAPADVREGLGHQEKQKKPRARPPVDDDSVTMPAWMFKVLHIKVGEPVCIMLDLSIVMEQEKLVERALQSVSLFPLQRNYKDMLNGAAAGKVGKVGTGAPRADAKGPELAQHVEAATAGQEAAEGKSPEAMALERDKASGALNAVLLKSLRAYRVLRVDQVLAFERNGEEFNFQVVGLSAHRQQEELPQPKPPSEASSPTKPEDAGLLYLNVGKRLSCVELERTALRQVGQAD